MNCPDCGADNADDVLACRKCGLNFPKPPRRYSPPQWLLIALSSIIILGSLVFILFPFLFAAPRRHVRPIKGDMRTITIALEMYYLDHNAYPPSSVARAQNAFGHLSDQWNIPQNIPTFRLSHDHKFATLTTPTAYVSSYFTDPFAPVKGACFAYWNPDDLPTTHGTGYLVWSPGPDGHYDITLDNVTRLYTPHIMVPTPELVSLTYDPSNGADSAGDIYRYKQ